MAESMLRYSRFSVCVAARRICADSSTPVGPAPTTANVSHARRASGSSLASAASNAPKMRRPTVIASSTVFNPGACLAYSSCPK